MSSLFTIFIPTHDHPTTLPFAVASALDQTIQDFEIVIMGDGVTDETRLVVQQLLKKDQRIRFLDLPKGPRNGEVNRHPIVHELTSKFVAYLTDDDIWFPNHLSYLLSLFEEHHANFVHALPTRIEPDGSIFIWLGDTRIPFYLEKLQYTNYNFIPLNCAAHSVELYRHLPFGWRTTPKGMHTDHYMWQQVLRSPFCRPYSGNHLTVIHLPTSLRKSVSSAERKKEMESWWKKRNQKGFQDALSLQASAYLLKIAEHYHILALQRQHNRIDNKAKRLVSKVKRKLQP